MAKEPEKKAAAEEQDQQARAPMTIHGQYIKDLSFEVPNAPAIFGKMTQNQPDISINVDVNAARLAENQFEVILSINATCKVGEDVAFIAELAYAGIFELNVEPEHVEPMMLIECPRMLFPFARNILASTTRDGSFPPLMLNPVDFAAMYRQRLEQILAEKQAEGTPEN